MMIFSARHDEKTTVPKSNAQAVPLMEYVLDQIALSIYDRAQDGIAMLLVEVEELPVYLQRQINET
jgi:hypothetical protein